MKKKALKPRDWDESTRSKRLSGIFFTFILLSGTYLSLSSVSHAADSNPVDPDLLNRALSDLNNIAGIYMKQYTITQSSQREDSNILHVTQQVVDLHLASNTSTVRITVNYAKNKLMMVYVSDFEDRANPDGTLKKNGPAITPYGMATGMLLRYQKVTGDNEYGAIANGSFKNVQLETTNPSKDTTNFMWVYCKDGVKADRKNICISYEHGMLKYFMNNWVVYSIANTTCNFNETQAQQIALNFMKQYYYNYTFDNGTEVKVSDFSISNRSYIGHTYLTYINSADAASARGGDQTVFYLAWVVPMGFDRWYPGGVSIIPVILWADTGQVCSPAFSYDNQNDTVNATQSWVSQPVFMVAVSAVSVVLVGIGWLVYFKKRKR